MQVQRLLAMPLHATVVAGPLVKAQQARGVDQQHGSAQQAGAVEGLHAHQALDHAGAQGFPAGLVYVPQKVVEGIVNR